MDYNKEYDLLNLTVKGSQERRDIKPKVIVAKTQDGERFRSGDILDANYTDCIVKERCDDIYNYFVDRLKKYPPEIQLTILEELKDQEEELQKKLDQIEAEIHDKDTIEEILKDMDVAWFPSYYYADEDGIYYKRTDGNVYPINHPDLSTQPSILPQRFGNKPMYEVLIRNGYENEIPKDAIVTSAFSFNNTACSPASVVKNVDDQGNVTWTITNVLNIVPDYTIIQYINTKDVNPYYYYHS